MSDNDDEAFQTTRAFAEADYHYGRLNLRRVQNLPLSFSLVLSASGQLASGNLLRSEQLSLGGSTSLRGYEESAANGDQGWVASIELRSPPLPLLGLFGNESFKDDLVLLAFLDAGSVSSVERLPNEPSSLDLASVGVGLRYRFNTQLSVRFDYGWQIGDEAGFSGDDSRAHISVLLSY
jgi:hemolysin activation/secretion protein